MGRPERWCAHPALWRCPLGLSDGRDRDREGWLAGAVGSVPQVLRGLSARVRVTWGGRAASYFLLYTGFGKTTWAPLLAHSAA